MKKLLILALVGALAFSLVGCSGSPAGEGNGKAVQPLASAKLPEGHKYGDLDAQNKVEDDNPVSDAFTEAVNRFGYMSAAKLLAGQTDNQLYSPLSLYYALALAAEGAKGGTQEQMLALAGVKDPAELAKQAGNLFRLLYKDNAVGKLQLANSLWLRSGGSFQDAYLKQAAKDFYASVYSVDFSDPATGKAISDWIKKQTHGTLDYQFEPDPQQMLSIFNTLYLKDEWTIRFDKTKTAKGAFCKADGTKVESDFMHGANSDGSFFDGDRFTRGSLALKNGGQVVFVLPDKGVSLEELTRSPGGLKSLFSEGDGTAGVIEWSLPKFGYDTSMDLIGMLQSLGMTDAFDGAKADFSGITDNIHISKIKQNAHVALNEEGVEASAFTEISFRYTGVPGTAGAMTLDRPFLYGIMDHGVLLFVGVVNDPTK